ncbi:hypothetical protein [Caldimonas tepidiphila]|uniref:hypothetical protein n=1 Tax=Caldimonas tepidiphila TaxID=2315841 RepID=UPI000E5A7875|nr:hypothetical protein [Caldimonas tepidiphila]
MSIVVFWLAPADDEPGAPAGLLRPQARAFGSSELSQALAHCESLRRAGMRHVAISSEPDESVTLPGVSDALPEGYDWKKRRE